MQTKTRPSDTLRTAAWLVLAASALWLAGCASAPAQGYGAAEQSTAMQAQQQMEKAEQSTQIDPQQTYLNLIDQMQQANQWYASLAHADAFERQYGSNTQIRLKRADALRNTGQALLAEKNYQALLSEVDSTTQARARRGLGLLYASQQRYAQAVAQLEMARQLNPIDADVLADLAYTHMLDGHLAAASLPILQAAQLAPSNARVQLNLALYWLASGAQEPAAQLLQRLRQPLAKNTAPLIDQTSLQTLQAQLTTIEQAVRARANASAADMAPAAQAHRPAPGTVRTIVIGQQPPPAQAQPNAAPPIDAVPVPHHSTSAHPQ